MEKNDSNVSQLYDLLNHIPVTKGNAKKIQEIKDAIGKNDLKKALDGIKELNEALQMRKQEIKRNQTKKAKEKQAALEEGKREFEAEQINEDEVERFPSELQDLDLEKDYIGLLLYDPRYIVSYNFVYDEVYFQDERMLNLYKSVIFTEGEKYAPEAVKRKFNFAKTTKEVYDLKKQLVTRIKLQRSVTMEKVYTDLKKLFILRNWFLKIPIKNIQDKVVEIKNYELYDKMSVEEVENAVEQVTATEKFKRSVLNRGLTEFLETGENNLTNGIPLPFARLTKEFKGLRKGETMAIAMPSNSGKSRFTINLVANLSLVHKKRVLVISNEMSEEKMKLCLMTTIINDPEIQKIHGKKLCKTEGELLEFKFKPDEDADAKIDEDGFVLPEEGETRPEFVKRLAKISKEFRDTIAVTDWIDKEINNSIYFINITDHTNDELLKVIMNYYYMKHIEYVFYDTLKTDTEHIGNGEEVKKTATILSNLAQNFNMFIFSTLQLTETATWPINLTINDLQASRTVKEVLDTLTLVKQINHENYKDYEYSIEEMDEKCYDLVKYDDPDVRYYACVVDKNRAGAKPKLLFRLNLAYNRWEELGYLKLKQQDQDKPIIK
ncbi:MAG: DnaB-like helicase C-terminal domain-containing protein [Clostridia bacterium]|nr:DnaB-like helicase C-terminal domain-containing protein [Clostridia bacterium]